MPLPTVVGAKWPVLLSTAPAGRQAHQGTSACATAWQLGNAAVVKDVAMQAFLTSPMHSNSLNASCLLNFSASYLFLMLQRVMASLHSTLSLLPHLPLVCYKHLRPISSATLDSDHQLEGHYNHTVCEESIKSTTRNSMSQVATSSNQSPFSLACHRRCPRSVKTMALKQRFKVHSHSSRQIQPFQAFIRSVAVDCGEFRLEATARQYGVMTLDYHPSTEI